MDLCWDVTLETRFTLYTSCVASLSCGWCHLSHNAERVHVCADATPDASCMKTAKHPLRTWPDAVSGTQACVCDRDQGSSGDRRAPPPQTRDATPPRDDPAPSPPTTTPQPEVRTWRTSGQHRWVTHKMESVSHCDNVMRVQYHTRHIHCETTKNDELKFKLDFVLQFFFLP